MKRRKLTGENAQKMQKVYLEHRKFLYFVAYSIVKDHALAEDAVHDTFANLIGHEEKIDENNVRKTKSFLAAICKHEAIDIYNKRVRLNKNANLADEIDTMPDYETDLLATYLEKEKWETLVARVRKMDPTYQSIFELRFKFDYSCDEIAQILKIEPTTVRKRIERMRDRLSILGVKEER